MDIIPAEIYETVVSVTLETFQGLLINIWEEEDIPNDATVIPAFKNKGSRADCGNHWGILFLSIAGKIWLMSFCTTLLPAFQRKTYQRCSVHSVLAAVPLTCFFLQFSSSRRSVLNRIGICMLPLYIWPKAFDIINGEALWVILSKLRCLERFINLICLFHDDMTGVFSPVGTF